MTTSASCTAQGNCREPADQDEVPCTVASLEEFGHLRGTVVLPGGHRVVCGVFATLLDDGGQWLTFYLPTEALTEADERREGYLLPVDGLLHYTPANR